MRRTRIWIYSCWLIKSGLFGEDDTQILLCFSFTTTYPTAITPSLNAYKIQFDPKQAEDKIDFESTAIIEKGT